MAAETESTCSQATEHRQAGTPIIETASATTSADNANSGSKPYVIAAVGLAALLALSLSVGSCVSDMITAVAYGINNGLYDDYDYGRRRYDDYDDGDVYERLEELVREDGRLGSGYGSGTLSTSSLS
ncbi:hypothetical protein [Olsenella uli]|uniref:hypothetical protein n=1 Tax=Olsenella uli TaxID=133926 RepID=UPI0028E73511|nr:hypothetical protein [Olsenella uli]